MSNSDGSVKSNNVKQLLSVLSANESFSMFQLTNQGCFSHPGFLPSEDAISMPPPVSEALLPQYLWLPGTGANPGCGGAADVARAVVSQTNESVGILGSLQERTRTSRY